jgi:hypothetical protein
VGAPIRGPRVGDCTSITCLGLFLVLVFSSFVLVLYFMLFN